MIANVLIDLFPENATLYQENFNGLEKDLVQLDKDIDQELLPFKGDAILVSHPAFGYFCRDYGLTQLSIECEGKDPLPRDLEKIIQRSKTFNIRCVFLQQGFNNQGARILGKKLNLPNYEVKPFAEDYLENMREISNIIAK